MWAKSKEDGCKNKMSLFFLILNIVIAFSLGVISAYMSSNGCSRAFAALAIICFLYLVLNVLLIFLAKVWTRCFNFINLFLIFTVFVVSVVALGYSVYQSTCDVIACYNGESSEIDSFYYDFHSDDKSSFEDQFCDLYSNKVIGQKISQKIAIFTKDDYDSSKQFYIVKGWPIGFLILQMLLSIMHMIATFLNLYTCKGCKPKSREESYISYF
ncbi:hypothetical protein ABPG72_018145 [Tetrahymena utriculariae]